MRLGSHSPKFGSSLELTRREAEHMTVEYAAANLGIGELIAVLPLTVRMTAGLRSASFNRCKPVISEMVI
jgi:hypothetical protein